ncbi:hypothetical protein IFT98_20005 [Pseudomonas sp. CFBP 8770]|uniref:hypothetical protein n=1 Tax=unclassified Pseudomonas TaxID=196821 RepID=UPI001786EE7C|nr:MULTISPECIES: hypothetical protein [unclassified Pseudomonas]MBD8472489.1 hypothetical protein [Pseudomonas sp. CFBP 8773]MBD8649278.1 hypothetical protein [Pseudomonas sp. CFBP 8770]
MTNPADLGASIAESFKFVSNVSTECEALLKLTKEQVSQMLSQPDVKQIHSAAGEWMLSYQENDTGWLNTEFAASLALKQGRKKKPSGHVFVQISLMGCGIDALNNFEPLIHVGWWHDPIVFGETYMGFPIESGGDYQLELEDGVLFRWTHRAATDEWCYSLRLTNISSVKDVQDLIVVPLKRLLMGETVLRVLGNLPVVRYSTVEGLSGQFSLTPA